jgi:hypothetical protein
MPGIWLAEKRAMRDIPGGDDSTFPELLHRYGNCFLIYISNKF